MLWIEFENELEFEFKKACMPSLHEGDGDGEGEVVAAEVDGGAVELSALLELSSAPSVLRRRHARRPRSSAALLSV